jgi:lipopolysaccharide transport system permease protein
MISTHQVRDLTIIDSTPNRFGLGLKELWQYRSVLQFMTMRDIKARYQQTLAGPLWAILQPVMTMVVFAIVFGKFAKMPSDGFPYPVFSYVGLLPWTYFGDAVTGAGGSLVANPKLLTRIYFPRLIIPLSSVVIPVVDFVLAFVVLVGLMLYYGIAPTWRILTLPIFLLAAGFTAFAVSLWLSAANVVYRDVKYVLPFIKNVWLYLSPVAYPLSVVPEQWRTIYSLNPMTGVIEGFRWALLGSGTLNIPAVAASLLAVLGLFLGGLAFFNRVEDTFADLV